MTIFLAGASGFIGERVLEDLLKGGYRVIAHVHSDHSRLALKAKYPNLEVVQADLSRSDQTNGIIPTGTEAIVYLPGVLRESKGLTFEGIHVIGVENLLREAKAVGVERWIQVSAQGAAQNGRTKYYQTKWKAEQFVKQSGIDWTIVRPSLVFDDRPRRQHNFVGEIVKAIKMAPFVPILGSGKFLLQPVSLDDVSQTVVQSLSKPETIGKIYEVGGPQKMTYTEIVSEIAKTVGTHKPRIRIPLWVVMIAAALLDWMPIFPVTRNEIRMLTEGNHIRDEKNEREWRETFDLPLKPFVPVVN